MVQSLVVKSLGTQSNLAGVARIHLRAFFVYN